MSAEQRRLGYMLNQVATLRSIAKVVQENASSVSARFWTHEIDNLLARASVLIDKSYTVEGIYAKPE